MFEVTKICGTNQWAAQSETASNRVLGWVGEGRERSVHPTDARLNGSLWSVRPLAKASVAVEKFTQLQETEPPLS